jgi:hypothetical protein
LRRQAIPHSVLGNIERAVKFWSERHDCLAYMHLPHARLPALEDPYESARLVFMANGFMKAGLPPRVIFEALRSGASYIDAIEKVYNPAEPRVPAGSGRTSGEWTRLLSMLGDLTAEEVVELGAFALRLSGPVATLGLLFIPSPNNLRVEGEVLGIPGLRYAWNRDESLLHLTYNSPDGAQHTFTAELDDDVFRDERGRVIGRLLPGGSVAIDPAAVSSDLVQEDEPKLCPAPKPDRPGGSERGRAYENYIKQIVNPDNPTPSGWGYWLIDPSTGEPVVLDDCERATVTMIEIKGEYSGVLAFGKGKDSVREDWLEQSASQLAAVGNGSLRWYFAEQVTADFARELFRDNDAGRERIEIRVVPWPEKKQ